jgi:hypothetical protein
MNSKAICISLVLVGYLTLTPFDAQAKTIPANSTESGSAFTDCAKNGGTNWPQTPENPTYGCIDEDGHGLVCGGGTEAQKKSCTTFRAMPPPWPTRDEALKAGQDEERKAAGSKTGGT